MNEKENTQTPPTVEQTSKFDKYFQKTKENKPVIEFKEKKSSDWPTDFENRCLGCGFELGEMNPRQLCNKTNCPYWENSPELF